MRSLCLGLVLMLLLAACGQRPASPPEAALDTGPWSALVDSAMAALHAGEIMRSDSLARSALAAMDVSTPPKPRYTALWYLGAGLHQRGLEDTARHVLKEALELAVQYADSGAAASIGKELAFVLDAQGDYPGALALLMRSLRHQEEQGDSMKQANTLMSIAKVYYMQDDDSAARAGYEQAIAIYRAIGDSAGIAIGLNNLCNVMIEQQEFGPAIELLKYNFALRSRIMPKKSRAAMEANLSKAHLGLQHYDSALVHARGCMGEAVKHGQRDMQALAWVGAARALRMLGRPVEALAAADSSRRIATELGRPEQVSEAHRTLYLIHRDKGEHAAALRHAERHFALDDSLVNVERNAQMVEMRTRYAVANTERENERLRAAGALVQARAESARYGMMAALGGVLLVAALAALLLQRGRHVARRREAELEQQVLRSQMDPHFLFNALNTIPGLYATGDVATANDHVGHLSRFLRSVLETSRRRTVALARELELVQHYLHISANRNPGRFTWGIEVRPYVRPEHVAVPPMLVQPIVENALEHGLRGREGGRIDVRVDMAGSVLIVEVEDDGAGRRVAAERPSPPGHGSLGIGLVRERMRLFDPGTPAHEAVVVIDKEGPDGAPAGTKVVLRMRVQTLNEHAALGDRG